MELARSHPNEPATPVRLSVGNWIAFGSFIGAQTVTLIIIAAGAFNAVDKRLVRVETLLSEVATHRQQSTEARLTRLENTAYGPSKP